MIYNKWARMETLRPAQLVEFIRQCPIAYVPAGIFEWHEKHNPMGTDTIKMQEIAERTARLTGGVVHMPVYTGVGAFYGKKENLPHGGINFEEDFVREYILHLCGELNKLGFQLIVLLFGHTNIGNINAYEGASWEFMEHPDNSAKVLALSDVNPVIKHRYKCRDHAAKWETSFMMASCPDAVRMDELDPDHGAFWGLDPRIHASAAEGERMYTLIAQETAILVQTALSLPKEQISSLNFAAVAGVGSQPCWLDCRNIEDLKTDYWKGDKIWEDPCCHSCAWRTSGVTSELATIKGVAWMEELAAYWQERMQESGYHYKQYKAICELLTEWEAVKIN